MYSNHKAPRTVSRRIVLGTAGVGAVGAAAATLGIMKALEEGEASPSGATGAVTAGDQATAANSMISPEVANNPLVAFLENQNGDEVLFFYGTEQIAVKDAALVAAMKKAANL